jgi:hypothetical protein
MKQGFMANESRPVNVKMRRHGCVGLSRIMVSVEFSNKAHELDDIALDIAHALDILHLKL